MSKGKDKINLFEDFDEPEVITVSYKANPTRKVKSSIPTRTIETLESYIIGTRIEYHTNVEGEVREIHVKLIRPEPNMFEFLKPAYAYGTFGN